MVNTLHLDVLQALLREPAASQRKLAGATGVSAGSVNTSLKALQADGYLDAENRPTQRARALVEANRPKNAVILAAGPGLHMAPIHNEVTKGLIKVNGDVLIERLIGQLHAAGVTDISVVVGFQKEKYEYLIDKYGVMLVVNPDYQRKNNIWSLYLARRLLGNTYIVPCDTWYAENPFSGPELYAWYLVGDAQTPESSVRVNRKNELVAVKQEQSGHQMLGAAYLPADDARALCASMEKLLETRENAVFFWERALMKGGKMAVHAKQIPSQGAVEINTFNDFLEADSPLSQLKTIVLPRLAGALHAREADITDFRVMKKGMTNRSFLCTCKDKRYILRMPGEGTELLINRENEADVYAAIVHAAISDNVVYFDRETGLKMTEFLDDSRCCNAEDPADVQKCMQVLRNFHALGLKVEHTFDIFGQMELYETLRGGAPSLFSDYEETKAKVAEMRAYLDTLEKPWGLTHIDANPDNFLFWKGPGGEERISLIDWEYAGMQDPHVDIAMFGIYAYYNRAQMDSLIDAYFPEGCPEETRTKIYCYVACCGFLWSNWCDYKRILGVEFGEYSLTQYRYAKDYYAIVRQRWGK